ncbi:hypothetical protein B0T10DRAFT_463956 [Thelonectria olida]|uniref:Uncharacterized protein n=1 Tax=Thelonectria olida TaxID=1576542 RepID=A0A9P8VVW2_9HYPO|nr:hypothetical protein B0T10DRAFT_463956 [Thelonectria olida]
MLNGNVDVSDTADITIVVPQKTLEWLFKMMATHVISFLATTLPGNISAPSQAPPLPVLSLFAMVGTSVWGYVFVRTSIFLLHLAAPLSVVYSLASWLVHLPFRIPLALEIWLAFETAFYLFVYLPRKAYLQTVTTHPCAPCRDDRRRLFWRCHSNIPDPNQYLKKWFRNAPASEIKRENVKDFFQWAFLNTGELDPAYDEELEEYVGAMEKLLRRKLEPGRGNANCLRLTLDKCVFIVDTAASIYLRYYSFDFHRTSLSQFLSIFPLRPLALFTAYRSPAKTLTYWYRPHTSKSRLPIVFIHGIGIGLYPYIPFLADLNAKNGEDSDEQVGIIAIEILPISSRITAAAMLKDETREEVYCILKAHDWERFALVSHSSAKLRKRGRHASPRTPQIARKIGPILFVDPISFLLHLPDVAYNFICRKPSHANEHLLSYFGSKDMGLSHTLFRRFIWADNALWKEDIQCHDVTVVLAGRDMIVDTKVIGAYLTGADE